ncbi:conserved Plasmodium protein, unknown function [Plasmodium knowlesi strain H]|uniref:Uncharacterized protein n=3 Tax=Plasmodium knowlesi TaxID=5850 RepID=A0A5K1UFK7_PLAKH|nr:conserved Plasmodium protein, unknown function [Plasmodium knowlesi strain H]OTN67272.1 Uncharacterized protein PKNOH_S06420100 [Plasmodium knowlesi]CAA9987474.1 conserved Plasmodium protein, unknown function [Plasmodium knowlesi strain H]SBO23209.1 conserved Plasmodium protein, unknown function [Plasmodium knowlesi strain H]SBO23978.1 conserved Plasmodium protein, unknown function [Plasmodium knowlesi strain H]VVS76948.1 conserved Plasmodium protein, unknown function [Plasmodium knowlesi s|eukprot:XP_002258475.1 hypothetical protein, conserved in Plasmodium species [Plasmodium knowlesi strain H]
MMFNESNTNSRGLVNKWCMPKGDYSSSSSSDTPGGLYQWGKEEDERDNTNLMQNTLYLFNHIKNDKYIFSKIIENVITFLNKLKEENKYYEFLFSYSTFLKKYGPLAHYTSFKKVIETINQLNIIEVCISFNFSNDSIFQTLLSSYLELNLNEANNIYNILLELTNVVIDGYAIWEEQNTGDSNFVDILISQCELKYISREEINKWFSYVKQNEDNYSHVLFSLIDFCLNLINHVHCSLAEGSVTSVASVTPVTSVASVTPVESVAYAEYVNELVVLRRSPSPCSREAHHNEHAERQSEKLTTDERDEEVRRENTELSLYSPNDVTSESDNKKERATKLTTYVKDTPGHIYICTFGENVVCMKNGDNQKEHIHDITMNKDRNKFVYEIKSRNTNLYILKILVCIILKALKVAHHLNQDLLKNLFSFFNKILRDIIKCIYEKNDVLFLNLFFTDILKTIHVLISFYNENIEQTPKRTMLFYKCFNKVIDQVCIYLHNKTFFRDMFLGRVEESTHLGKSLQKYAHNFKETCYMLFCLFYAILEKLNRVNNEIFLFFCCVLDAEEEGVLEPRRVNESASQSTEPCMVKSLYRTLCLNRKFLHKCRKDLGGKSINRIINIFIFLEKKINKYFFFFKYIFGYVWNRFSKGALNSEGRASRVHPSSKSDYLTARRRWPLGKPPNKLQTVMKRIKYVLLDMFTKYTKLLMAYRFHFPRFKHAENEKEPFRDEFLMYMKSIEWVLFSIFVYSPNGVLTKLNGYATESGKLIKLAHGGRSQFSAFNRDLYCFSDGKYSVPSDSSSGTSNGASGGTSIGRSNWVERYPCVGDSPDNSDSDCHGKNSQMMSESYPPNDEWGARPCDFIVLNALCIIYANIMEELTSHRYRYVYFKQCLVHAEFMKKLRLVLLGIAGSGWNGGNAATRGEAQVSIDMGIDGGRHHFEYYFDFPYELLCVIIIRQLKFFSNDTLVCYTICTAMVEFLFYISSSMNPYFFTMSRRLWTILGHQINKNEETMALKMLTKIFFHILSGRRKEDTVLRSRNERLFTQSIFNNDQQHLLLSFLRKQFFVNDVGKNYIFFYGTLLRGIQSEELVLGVMEFFFGSFHVHLQYTLNVLVRFLNLYERGVDASAREAMSDKMSEATAQVNDEATAQVNYEATAQVNYEATAQVTSQLNDEEAIGPSGKGEGSSALEVPLSVNREGTSEPMEEDNIISLYVYFDLVNVFPANFLTIISDINLMREIQKTILFFTYVNDEYKLLEQREEEHKHMLMVKRIKRTGMQYYHSSAKIYFPLVISSLISHYLIFILRDVKSRIPCRIICNFYENFFSNRYLYTLCSNNVYMRVLSDSFIILQYLRQGGVNGEITRGDVFMDHPWGVVKGTDEDTNKSSEVDKHNPEKYTKEDLSIGGKDRSSDKAEGECSNQMDTLSSCLFQVYIHFLEEYATMFHVAIVTLVKNKIMWCGESGRDQSKGFFTTTKMNEGSTLKRLNDINTPRRLSEGSNMKRLYEPIVRSDFAALDESTFCQKMYFDLNQEGKYSSSFRHLMRSVLDVFFCKPGMVLPGRGEMLAKQVVAVGEVHTQDKVHLLQARRNKILITFFRNTFYVHSCAGDYIKDSLSRLVGAPPFGKNWVCCKELEELARLVFCVVDCVDV